MNYIPVHVLENKSLGNSSNNGVSVTNFNNLFAQVEGGNLSLEDVQNRGGIILELVERKIGANNYKHFAPKTPELEGRWTMFGGCFISASDSRFSKTYGNYPLALHDRVE
ncbi:hypothetical protein OTK49_21345 [Vibrio coralliirubri]|uniref:hypothetical protein n=1 Tax=Vibrio coralliirubri TaxID=1516159 RepID=UPI00228475A5|nr:hypothetical protein [Vibrio coralliirubri]MCY9865067.1 hypothetical protein [Vibrio coralliirubri]